MILKISKDYFPSERHHTGIYNGNPEFLVEQG
jgi:hypothetical protein